MPNFSNYSSFNNFLSLITPWINPAKFAFRTPAERKAALPKKENYQIFIFVQTVKGIEFTNRLDGSSKLAKEDTYQAIYAQLMGFNVYLELREPYTFLPSREVMLRALEKTRVQISDNSNLPESISSVIAEYVLDEDQIYEALGQYGIFKPDSKALLESKKLPITLESSNELKVQKLT